MRFASSALAFLTIHASAANGGWNSWGGGGRPTNKPTRRPSSNTWGSSPWGNGPTDWIWNGFGTDAWDNDAWTGDGWNGKQKFPTRMPTSKPISRPPTSMPTSHPTTRKPTSLTWPPTVIFPTSTPTFISGSPSMHPSESPTIDSTNAPSIAISAAPSMHPSESPTIDSTNAPSIAISVAPSMHPSPSPSFVSSVQPSVSSFPSISPSVSSKPSDSSVPSISPSASLKPSISKSPSSNPSVSNAPSIVYYAAAQSGPGTYVSFDDLTAWSPNCTLSDEECKLIFCDGVRNTLQTQLCTDGPGKDYSPCNVGVVCAPEDLAVGDRDVPEDLAVEDTCCLGIYAFPFSITFAVECDNQGCTNETPIATEAARVLGLLRAALGNVTIEEYNGGIKQALEALNPQSRPANEYFTNTFSFVYDPDASALTGPVIKPVQQEIGDWELVGVGYCKNSFGQSLAYNGYYVGNGWTNTQECISRCVNNECLNSKGLTLRGIAHGPPDESPRSRCFCFIDFGTVGYPDDGPLCLDVDTVDVDVGNGTIVNVNGNVNWLCYRPKLI